MANTIGIYTILNMLAGDLLADPGLILESLNDNPEYKAFVISCSKGSLTYPALLSKVSEII